MIRLTVPYRIFRSEPYFENHKGYIHGTHTYSMPNEFMIQTMATRASRIRELVVMIKTAGGPVAYKDLYEVSMRKWGVSASTARSYALQVMELQELGKI